MTQADKPTPPPRRLLAHPLSETGRERAAAWLSRMPTGIRTLWVGHQAPADTPRARPAQLGHWLGREVEAIVFEAPWPLPTDALAIAGGMLRGGGVLLLLAASPGTGPFGQRWDWALHRPPLVWVDSDPEQWPLPAPAPPASITWTQDQLRALEDLQGLAPSECRVLMAPRGRGKSTVLGEWLARRDRQQPSLALSAPNERALAAAYQQLASRDDNRAAWPAYCAPDQAAQLDPAPDTLVLDEAAALPVDRLVALAGRSHRLLLATTTGGFEGSGQGFRLRALPALQNLGFRVHTIRLEEPVRWAADDPLEAWLDDLFLLRAESRLPAPQAVRFRWLRGAELAKDERRLEDVAGLLADAHYRTRPSDLARWLEDSGVRLILLTGARDGALFGVALIQEEAGVAPTLAEAVWAGERRPQGHFLPCTLAARGEFALAQQPWWRIQRLAVHPAWQGKGLGRRLLQAVEESALEHGISCVGTSFGLQPALVRFWGGTGWRPVRVGERPDPASGEVSVVLVKALAGNTTVQVETAARSFARDWREVGAARLNDASGARHQALEALFPPDAAALPLADSAHDMDEIRAFAQRQRPFEWTRAALRRALQEEPPRDPEGLLLQRASEIPDGDTLARELGLSGRREAIRRLRLAARNWLEHVEA